MNKQSPKQMRPLPTSSEWQAILKVVTLFILFACNHQDPKQIDDQSAQKTKAILNNTNYRAAPPKSTPITSANSPKVVKAGKPVIRIDSSNGGAPFFDNYGTDQGLALSSVQCSIVDDAGNLWFGTLGGGASRYDGKSFTNFTPQNGLAGGGIYSLMEDSDGNIWFGTDGEGISKFDGYRFISYTTKQGLAGNFVISIMQDQSGNIWFGTEGGGVSRYDGKTFTNYTIAKGLAGNNVNSILQVRSGDIWFGTDKGASKYNGKSFTNFTTQQGLPVNPIASLFQDKTGDIWFGTEGGGVSRYDGITFANYSRLQGLAGNSIRSIQQDNSGSMWFCSQGHGISRYIGSSLKNYTSTQAIYSIIQDKTGKMWFGSRGGGVTSYDGKRFMNFTTDQGLINNDVKSLMQDTSGNIWIGSFGGVSMYDGKSFTNFTKAQGFAARDIWSIMQDRAGNIWFGSNGGGVSMYDGKSFKIYDTSQGLGGNDVWSIHEDKSGHIWFGTHNGGISKFDGRSFTNYSTAQGLPGNNIYSMLVAKDGSIWIGTDGNGASHFNGKNFTNYSISNGLSDNVVYALAEDTIRNIVWMGTNKGFSAFKRNSESDGNTFEIFNKTTGYPIKDLNVNDICVDKNGILWGGTGDNYLIKLDYQAVKKSSAKPNLVIQNIKINNEDISWYNLLSHKDLRKHTDSLALINEMGVTFGNVLPSAILDSMHNKYGSVQFDSISRFYPVPTNLVLPYEDNNLTIEFAAIEPDLPKQVRYQYKLEGYDKDWSPLNNNTTAVFGNIPEGSYTFRLKALSPYGVWGEPIVYTFRVLPPWGRTWWAYTIYGIFIVAGIFITDRIRRKVVIEKERAKAREKELEQAKEIEKAYTELKSTQAQLIQQEKMASLGELTAGIAHEIQNPLNFVNNFSETNTELLEEAEAEFKSGNQEEGFAILSDIKANAQKINHHGKRADSIVKGMLEHSRTSSSEKELTDLSKLVDEYLRLAYYGFRAKDKSFNALLQTHFDESVGKVNIVPQDIGRVLLNLFNNAFYAVAEKKRKADDHFKSTVTISTKKSPNKIEITVQDNGMGVSKSIQDKIFQPFFTTKPTGQGTGLGLSLSYDIIKMHGGELKLETKEEEYSMFTIELPLVRL